VRIPFFEDEMQSRMLMAGALFSGAMMIPALHAGSVTTRYKVAQQVTQDVDATAAGGPKQHSVVKFTSYVVLTLTDTTGGRSIRMVIDSIHGDSLPAGAPAEMLAKAKGAVVTGFVDAKGKVSGVKANGDAGGLPLTNLVSHLVPPMRPPLKLGDAWTDTTSSDNDAPGMSTRTVTNYKVTGAETRSGVKASKVDGAFSSSIVGTQETPGGSADIDGTGTGTVTYFIAPDGKVVGGTASSTSNLNVTLAAQGVSLPVVLSTSVEITPLP
jgi:hypothetical protein